MKTCIARSRVRRLERLERQFARIARRNRSAEAKERQRLPEERPLK
jgi:hypothetical protein